MPVKGLQIYFGCLATKELTYIVRGRTLHYKVVATEHGFKKTKIISFWTTLATLGPDKRDDVYLPSSNKGCKLQYLIVVIISHH